jgi:hypothetical protein
MADYKKIAELRPEMADFFGNRRLIAYRGDVLSYWANTRTDSFSTDAGGFRHSTLNGKEYSVADCVQSERYGIVLGASNLFGFGVAGNENTMASLLAERFGFPFANAAMPGGNSRNLHSLLVGLIAAGKEPPAVVVHSSGGELANFCESSLADPIFGSPNRSQLKSVKEQGALTPEPDQNFPRLLAFTTLWNSALAAVCRAYKAELVLIHQSTFFEKKKPTKLELECGLGEPFHPSQEQQFANHRKFNEPFYEKRKAIAEKLGVPLAGWGLTEDITFMDEFHGDLEGTRLISKAVGEKIEDLLERKEAPEAMPVA